MVLLTMALEKVSVRVTLNVCVPVYEVKVGLITSVLSVSRVENVGNAPTAATLTSAHT